MSPDVALITVTYNSREDLLRHWQNARALEAEWIVADNASTDGSAEVAESLGAKVIRLEQNLGFSAANNAAASHTTAPCLIFVNPDVEVNNEGTEQLAALVGSTGGLVAPQLLNVDGSPQENGRKEPYLYRKLLHFIGSESSGSSYEVVASEHQIVPVTWVIGAALAMSSSVFRAIGGWDEKFFIYYEDSDICLRAAASGFQTFLAGNIRWVHGWDRATRTRFSWVAWKNEFRSAWLFYSRYPRLLLHPRINRDSNRTIA